MGPLWSWTGLRNPKRPGSLFRVFRERRVGDCPPSSQEEHLQAHPHGEQQAPGHHLLPDHQTQTSLLHRQHHHPLRPHLLPGLARLLPARRQSVTGPVRNQSLDSVGFVLTCVFVFRW